MSDSAATVTLTDPATGHTVSRPAGTPVIRYGQTGQTATNPGQVQVVAVSDATASPGTTATPTPPTRLAGREPFLYAGVALIVVTVAVLGPLARRRPQWKVSMGLPYLVAFGLVSYAIDGSWQQAVLLAVACLLIVFGLTMLRLWRWRLARKPVLHAVPKERLQADRFVSRMLPALTALGFQPEAGYEMVRPAGSLLVLTLRHRQEPVVAQVRLTQQGARRLPHLVFATRLRGGGQVWTWNVAGVLPPQPPSWTTYHHAGMTDAAALYQLHLQHLAARPAVTVADKEADVAKRLVTQAEAELQAQENAGWLAIDGERYRLTGRAIWRWTVVAFFAFLGVPIERMRLPHR